MPLAALSKPSAAAFKFAVPSTKLLGSVIRGVKRDAGFNEAIALF
jgi:hypothetical protein